MLLTKEVEVKPTGKMIQYYKDKEYDVKWRQPLIVMVKDLPKTSKIKVKVQCDYCGKIKYVAYADYIKSVQNEKKYACSLCAYNKISQTIYERYGVDSYSRTEEFLKKVESTSLKKYGTRNPAQSEVIKQKMQNTVLSRYGVSNILSSPQIRERIDETVLKKYGNRCPIYGNEVFSKTQETLLERYGTIYPTQSPEIKAKVAQTLYKNGTTPTSKQQLYIFNLYNKSNKANLNYPISYYNADICFPDEKLDIEVDFGGHNLSVKTGKITQEEFDRKEIIRNNVIKREGYKQMRIISTNDKLPSDQILLEMLDYTRNYFSLYPNHSWIEFNITTSTIRNAEHKDGIPYDFGSLRTIKDSDLFTIENGSNQEETKLVN